MIYRSKNQSLPSAFNQPENCCPMLIKRFILICSVPAFVSGCAEFYGNQPPAPVYGNGTPLYGNKPLPQEIPKPEQQAKSTPQEPVEETVKTSPLLSADSINKPKVLKPERLPEGQALLTPAQEQELAALQQKSAVPEQIPVPEPEVEPKAKPKSKPEPELKTEPVVESPPIPEPVQETPNPGFQPLESFSPMSPAVGSLVLAANEDNQKGNVESATTTLERASRIEPRNATLYYKLALVKLNSKPSQAEDLAKKAALLAGNDPALKKHSWLLVAKAREMQKDFEGAKEARAKASKY
jgi:hypothetical protein